MSSPVVVDVGGTRFHTTIETLRNCPGRGDRSIFRDMNISCDKETFVDRDPTVFGYILNYLRDGSVTFPRDEYIITLTKYEAWYYGLHHLADELPAGDFHTVETSWDSEDELFRSSSSGLKHSHDHDSMSSPVFPVFSHVTDAIFSYSSERNDFNEVTTSACPEDCDDSDGISSSAESNYLCDCDCFSPVPPIYHRGINDETTGEAMRGLTIPAVNSAVLQNSSFYVQINIYDTNLKGLRERGVDVEEFLHHNGCRSIIMDVPIISSEKHSSPSLTCHSASENPVIIDEDRNCEVESNKLYENRQGPLTSTPMLLKCSNNFEKFLSTNCVSDKPPVVAKVSDVQMSDSYVRPQQKKSAVTSVLESSFAVVGRSVVDGLKAINQDAVESGKMASFHAEFEEDDLSGNSYEEPVDCVDDQVSEAEQAEVVPHLVKTEPNILVKVSTEAIIKEEEEKQKKIPHTVLKGTEGATKSSDLCSKRKRVHPNPPGSTDEEKRGGKVVQNEEIADNVSDAYEQGVLKRYAYKKKTYVCQFPGCEKVLVWRPGYGKSRLVDHVRRHWGVAAKRCKLCDFSAPTPDKIHYHHQHFHHNEPYLGALSTETKDDLKTLLEIWKTCFPGLSPVLTKWAHVFRKG
ncbi:unnamed protein product [Cylicocyclus nassatus]|uniref:Potassium channel tetramerisation-type BTB domain-containing protein n=1 Tax=Cylicocyclus nassatus TaxID=53992 RepID=A0AA36DVJ1_CYLNA|nr:unnamed protein product [Cylicocyclus nassatus]